MGKKKPQRSAIYFFAMDCKQKRNLHGSIIEIIGMVCEEWKSLSADQKAPYEKQYREWKSSTPISLPIVTTPYSSSSNVFSKEKADLNEIERFVNQVLKNDNDLIKRQSWYFIKFQSFCKADESFNPYKMYKYDPYYVLGEVSLIEYSILDGIKRSYHSFIKTNIIPTGHNFICKDNAERTHKIPLDGSLSKKTYYEVYIDIINFLGKDFQNGNSFSGLFCRENDYKEIKFGLDFIRDQSIEHEKELIDMIQKLRPIEHKLFNLECLLTVLGNLESPIAAHQFLDNMIYDYTKNVNCDYHENIDTFHCSLGYLKRYSFLLSEGLCPEFNCELTPNHLPVTKLSDVFLDDETYSSDSNKRTDQKVHDISWDDHSNNNKKIKL
jgi:hypothetical protein